MAQQKFEYCEDLFYIVMTMLPVLLHLSLSGKPATANLLYDLLQKLVNAQIFKAMPEVGMTAMELLKSQLPPSAYAKLASDCDDF